MDNSGNKVETAPPPRRRFYGWRLVLVGAFVLALTGDGFGMPKIAGQLLGDQLSYGSGSNGFVVGLALLRSVVPALLLPFVGWAVDRWGARRMVVWGFASMGGGFALLAVSGFTPFYYLSLLALVVGSTTGSQLPMAAAVNNWFQRRRATAMGLMFLPSVAAWLFVPTLVAAAGLLGTVNTPAAWLVVAAVVLTLIWPMSRLVRNRPEDYGQHPDGIDPGGNTGAASEQSDNAVAFPDYTWREAMGTRAFWLMTLGISMSSSVSVGVIFVIPLLLNERGFSSLESGTVFVVMTLSSLVGTGVAGMIGDRVPIRWAMFGCAALPVVATALQLFAETAPIVFPFAVLMGIGSGGLITLALAARGVYFGRSNFGTITGISIVPSHLIQLFAPVAGGLIIESQQSWIMFPAATMVVGSIGCLCFALLGNPRLSPSQSPDAELLGLRA